MSLRLLKSIVTFLEISVQAESKGWLCLVTMPLSKTALLLHSVFLLLYVIPEFMNFLKCHPRSVFAIVSFFNVRWNSSFLLKQMTSMFTCFYSVPPSQLLQHRAQADSTNLISAAFNGQGQF